MSTTIIDPVAQTFIVDSNNYPNGAYLSSICLFFKTKPTTDIPVTLSIMSTLNGYPTGTTLDNSIVTISSSQVVIKDTPHYKDPSSWTKFTFPCPVYINPDVLYAFTISSSSDEFTLWTAAQNQTALLSTSKANYTDATPAKASQITTYPGVGDMFESQNAMTWSADLTKDLMFVINRCKFNTGTSTIPFIVPAGLPTRKTSEGISAVATANTYYDALNLSTTDITPTGTKVSYQYTTTLNTGVSDGPYYVNPGKYGTALSSDLTLNDNKGYRVLNYAADGSFMLEAILESTNDAVSPIVSDDGLSLYTVRYRINNMGVANDNIILTSGGTGYLSSGNGTFTYPDITVSNPDESSGTQAVLVANVYMGVIDTVYVSQSGSGYTTTPTVTINAANTTAAVVSINGETDSKGGNGFARYVTNPVELSQGNDSGDLRVFFSAYRPTNTNIYVYYKILSREDTQTLNDCDWQLMTLVSGQSRYSTSRTDLVEYEAAPGSLNVADNYVQYTNNDTGHTYNNFYRYMIKIVLAAQDSTFTPFLKDMRTIALPSGTGL